MMIDKKHLMLGNLLYWQDDEIGKVEAILQYSAFIRDKEDTLNELKYHRLEPIPLTPEILERCGLAKETIYYHTIGQTNVYKLGTFYIVKHENGEYLCSSPHHDTRYKYLHQLQNLYYSLTGTELLYLDTLKTK